MAKLKLVDNTDTPRGVVENLLAADALDHADALVVLFLDKEGHQHLVTSRASMIDKSFLITFAQSWLFRWFND